MTTTVDFNSLQAAQGPRVVLMPSTHVGESTVGGVFDDFSAFASVYLTAQANLVNGNRGQPSLTITVEHSDDAMSWSTAATLSYGPDGKQSALVSSPKQYFRVTAAPGGSSVWQVVSVTAAPTYLDPAGGGGGGSQPVLVASKPIASAAILDCFSNPVEVIAAPGAGKIAIPVALTIQLLASDAAYNTAGAGIYLTTGALGSGLPTWHDLGPTLANTGPFYFTFGYPGIGPNFNWDPDAVNVPVFLAADTGNPTNGDGDISLTVLHYLVTAS